MKVSSAMPQPEGFRRSCDPRKMSKEMVEQMDETELQINTTTGNLPTRPEPHTRRGFSLETVIEAWLNQKFSRTGSTRTLRDYRTIIEQFRVFLQDAGRDLLYAGEDFHVEIADAAQIFSQMRWSGSKKPVSPATHQHRLAVISSFYDYCLKRRHLSGGNPLDINERPKVEAYAASQAIATERLVTILEGIDTTILDGKRDKAILLVLLTTGRRVSEMASLTREQMTWVGKQIELHFPRTKGNKSISDLLSLEVSEALTDWLVDYYHTRVLTRLPAETPLWVDLRHPSRRGQPLGYDGFAGICEKYLGTSKVHTTRGSFTIMMLEADAKLHEVQHRLQHENAATTGMYAGKLQQGANPYAGKLAEKLGLRKTLSAEEKQEEEHQ